MQGQYECDCKRETGSEETEQNKGCVTLCGLAIYIKKRYLKGKRRSIKIQLFHHAKKYNLQKNNLLKETKILQEIITL